jgi:hypothetical protein
MSYLKNSVQGKLEVYKDYGDFVEKVGEYNNIVTRGMGITITSMLLSGSRQTKNPYSIRYAQLGTGVVDYQKIDTNSELRYNFFKLNSPLNKSAYGTGLPFRVSEHYSLVALEEFISSKNLQYSKELNSFITIADSQVTVKNDSSVVVTLNIDKKTANGLTVREVGLFSDNVGTTGTKESVLVAYKQFVPIEKTKDFSIKFTWTIQVTNLGSLETWQSLSSGETGIDAPTTQRGNGGSSDPVPTLSYGTTAANPWLVELGLPIETLNPIISPTNAFRRGSFGLVTTGTTFEINPQNGQLSGNISVAEIGTGLLVVSAQPSSTNYNTVQTRVYYEASIPKGTPDPTSDYLGQIAWVVPSGAVLGASTVIHTVMPLSSGDFNASIWGSHNKWLVSGAGTNSISASGFVAQTHETVRDASGGAETVEVVFPTTIVSAAGSYQYYDIYSTSDSLPATTLSIPAYIQNNLYFYVKDLSGYQYQGNIWSGAATVSSILKDGPYKRVYRFYTRMLPQSWATTSPTDEKKPFALGLHVYLTIKKDDPIVGLDFKISNGNYDYRGIDAGKGIGTVLQNENQVLGNFYYSDLWFEVSSGVSAVSELERFSNVDWGNVYGDVNRYGLVNNFESIPEWIIRTQGKEGYFPSDTDEELTAEQKVLGFNIHGIGKVKKFHRRFRLFPVDNSYVTYSYAKEMGQFGDVAFPNRKRTWWTIPKWGPTKDLAPLINDDFVGQKSFNDTHFGNQVGDYFDNGPYKLFTNVDGMAGYNIISDNLYKYFEENTKYGLCRYEQPSNANPGGNYGSIGTRGTNFHNFYAYTPTSPAYYQGTDVNNSEYNWMYRVKTPHTVMGSRNLDIGGLALVHLYKGMFLSNNYLRLLNAESHFITDRYYGIFDFSGVPISAGQVMTHYGITSTTTTPTTIYEWGYGGYPGCRVIENNGKPFLFPKIYGSKKSNSKLCEPYEDSNLSNIVKLKDNPSTNSQGNIIYGELLNYNLVNACKYSYFSMPFNGATIFDGTNIAGYRPASPEHSSRVFPLMHAITTLTNDEMWKEEFESIAGFYSILMNPYPSSVVLSIPTNLGGGNAYSTNYSLTNFYSVLRDNPSGRGNGALGQFSNVRFLAFGIGGPAMYYQIASNNWRNQNQVLFEYAASALNYSYIPQNGLIGGLHLSKQTGASPNPQDIEQILAAGNTFSSIPTNPSKGYWLYNPSGKAYALGTNDGQVSWEPAPDSNYPTLTQAGQPNLYLQGGIYSASSYWVTVMQSHYQVYLFRCLVKSVKEFDPVISSGLNNACSSVARTLFLDSAFHNFSGCAEMPELPTLLSQYSGGTLLSILGRNPGAYGNVLTSFTINGNPLSSVDPNKTIAAPPEFLVCNTNSWHYPAWKRGTDIYGKGNFTIGNPASGFSGGDFNKFPSRSGFARNTDGHSTIAIGAIIAAGDNLSNLTSSNEFLNKSAWFNSNYNTISNVLDPAWSTADYLTSMTYALNKARTVPMGENNPAGLFYVAPLIAYIQYALKLNGNNT